MYRVRGQFCLLATIAGATQYAAMCALISLDLRFLFFVCIIR